MVIFMENHISIMRRKNYLLFGTLLVSILLGHAQSAPIISTQPGSQTNLMVTNGMFSVAVTGPGPFTYQWQCNGANLPNNLIRIVAGKWRAGYAGDGGA